MARAIPHKSWGSPIGNLVLVVLRRRPKER
jgi:hypothetical protein